MIGSFNWFFNFFPPCLFCFIALPVRTAPTPFREMFAEDPLPVLGAGRPAPGEEGGAAAGAVGVRCVHQGALRARGADAAAPFSCPPGARGKATGVQARAGGRGARARPAWAASNDIPEKNRQEASRTRRRTAARTDRRPRAHPAPGIFSSGSIWPRGSRV